MVQSHGIPGIIVTNEQREAHLQPSCGVCNETRANLGDVNILENSSSIFVGTKYEDDLSDKV